MTTRLQVGDRVVLRHHGSRHGTLVAIEAAHRAIVSLDGTYRDDRGQLTDWIMLPISQCTKANGR